MGVFAITGELAGGKSTVLKFLKKKGAYCFDADKRIHQYYRQKQSLVYKRIASSFPEAVSSGSISRRKLASIVFSDRGKLKKLEKIVHPVVTKDLLKWVNKAKVKKGIYIAEVSLLFEKKLMPYFEGVILVMTRRQILIRRIIERYNFSKKQALSRLSLYMPIREKIKRADFIVNNNSDFEKLEKEVDLLWKKIRQN